MLWEAASLIIGSLIVGLKGTWWPVIEEDTRWPVLAPYTSQPIYRCTHHTHPCVRTRRLTHKAKRSNVAKEGGFIRNPPCSCGCGQKPCLEAVELKAASQRPLGGDCDLYTWVKGSSQRSCPQRRCAVPLTRNGGWTLKLNLQKPPSCQTM